MYYILYLLSINRVASVRRLECGAKGEDGQFQLPKWSCLNCLLPSLGWLIDGSIGQLRKCPQGKKGGRGEEEFDV